MNQKDKINLSNALKIRGWSSQHELTWLAQQARRCTFVIEVGTFAGRSARAMADNMSKDSLLITVDPLDPTRPDKGLYRQPGGPILKTRADGDEIYKEQQENLKGLVNTINYRQDSESFARWYHNMNQPFRCNNRMYITPQMVFLDGAHTYEAVKLDIELWMLNMKSGSLLCGHDYYSNPKLHPGVKRAVDEVLTDKVFHPVGSIWAYNIQ